MIVKDSLGHALSAAEHYDTALRQFRCYIQDPVATLDQAIEAAPGFVMAHVVKACLNLLGTEPGGFAVARDCLTKAAKLPADQREAAHRAAAEHLAANRWHEASRALADIAIEHPRDQVAIQVGHQIDFFTGEARMLRDRIARALPAWDAGVPGYHAMLGMHAFGLEEMGDYAKAEALGKRAVELERRDGWAWHAVAHVLEMQGRQADGVAWMRADTDAWSNESFFQVHNWWHLALYHLDMGQIDTVLELFDGPIHGARSKVVMDMLDGSAMLWRLHLRGIDVGHRWQTIADGWEPIADGGNYAFNDMHAMMAFVGAGRAKAIQRVLDAQADAVKAKDDNAMFTREVGAAAARAILAFGEGDYKTVVGLIRPIRNHAGRFGGSHAQRDVLTQTLTVAALKGGQHRLACALANERIALKPRSASGYAFLARALAGLGDKAAAAGADKKAAALRGPVRH
jgi:tetratricopeptide (TPR) repeat protein